MSCMRMQEFRSSSLDRRLRFRSRMVPSVPRMSPAWQDTSSPGALIVMPPGRSLEGLSEIKAGKLRRLSVPLWHGAAHPECPLSRRVLEDKQTSREHRESDVHVESPGGLSPPGAPRTVREPLDSYGSRCSAVAMA